MLYNIIQENICSVVSPVHEFEQLSALLELFLDKLVQIGLVERSTD